MIIIISFWITFGIFILLTIINSDFLEDRLRGLLAFFVLLQTILIIGATILGETIFNTSFELLLGYTVTAYALWRGLLSGFQKDSREVSRKIELLEDETNVLPKIRDDTQTIVESIKVLKRKK